MKYYRHIILIFFLVLSVVVFSFLGNKNNSEKLIKVNNISRDVNGWEFLYDIKLDKITLDILKPEAYVFRVYNDSNNFPITFLVIYHQNKRWGAHNPQVCYKSQGWDLPSKTEQIDISKDYNKPFLINRFIIEKKSQKRLVYYFWFSSDKKLTHSRRQQMYDMVIHGIFEGFIESGFVRISIPLTNSKIDELKIKQLEKFTNKIIELLKVTI